MHTEERLTAVSPDELHRFLLKAYRIGNRARHKFARALLAMYRWGACCMTLSSWNCA